jgi:hypothetical protein
MHLNYRSTNAEIGIVQSSGPVLTGDAPATQVSLGNAIGEFRQHLDPMGRPARSLTWSINGVYYQITAIPDDSVDADELVRIALSLRAQ